MVTASCPTCKLVLKWDLNNPFRPFCSERCKLIDLGAWADDVYVIPDASPYPEDLVQEFVEEFKPEDDE